MDISVWQGIISAQLSPPGSPQHDRLWLLLENWNLGSVAPAIPDEPDRTAAKTLVKQILAEDRIHLVQSKQAIEIQGTSGASYLIKTIFRTSNVEIFALFRKIGVGTKERQLMHGIARMDILSMNAFLHFR